MPFLSPICHALAANRGDEQELIIHITYFGSRGSEDKEVNLPCSLDGEKKIVMQKR